MTSADTNLTTELSGPNNVSMLIIVLLPIIIADRVGEFGPRCAIYYKDNM